MVQIPSGRGREYGPAAPPEWSLNLEFEIDSLGNSYLGQYCTLPTRLAVQLDAIYPPCLSFPHTNQIYLLIPVISYSLYL